MFQVYSLFTILLNVLLVSTENVCNSHNFFYEQPGDVIFIGILPVHSGENCSILETKNLQLAESVITSVEAMRNNKLMPGLNIGLLLYDSCDDEEMAQKSLVSALIDAECSLSTVIGTLTSEKTEVQIRNISLNIGVPPTVVGRLSEVLRAEMAVRVLYELHWTPVDYFLWDDEKVAQEFIKALTKKRICVHHILNSTTVDKVLPESTVVIMMDPMKMKEILVALKNCKVLVVPLDETYTYIENMSSVVNILLPTSIETPFLNILFNISSDSPEENDNIHELTKSGSSLLQVQTMSDLLFLLTMFKTYLKEHCPVDDNWRICSKVPRVFPGPPKSGTFIKDVNEIKYFLKALKLNTEYIEEAVIIEHNSKRLQKIGSLRIVDSKWTLSTDRNLSDNIQLCPKKSSNISHYSNCSHCLNYNLLYTNIEESESFVQSIKLREEGWVAALLSISSVGILCCVAIAIFIFVRICKKDILEGNPGFSFLMLLSIIFMYLTLLPFSFKVVNDHHYYKGIFCGLRMFGTSLSYSLVFSVMLSRSLMLASADDDGGFMSHVNGYLQTILCFFIAVVQVALTLQFWTINWFILSKEQCIFLSRGPLFLLLLGYDMFLLILLLCVSPFIMKSKRNYHEGSYFAVSSIFCLIVWTAWCSGYVFLPEWEDICICFGLVATATIILVIVFIPRTYLMLTGIVRDHLVSTLPSLGHTTSTSVIDVNYRSTQALYDSVTITRGGTTPNYYAERPTTPSTSKLEDDRIPEPAYERYSSSPSPHNITRF